MLGDLTVYLETLLSVELSVKILLCRRIACELML